VSEYSSIINCKSPFNITRTGDGRHLDQWILP
jgi:hypothetical protein